MRRFKKNPQIGDYRRRRRFLWVPMSLPCWLDSDTTAIRWLETAEYAQVCDHDNSVDGVLWSASHWTDLSLSEVPS